MTEFKTQKALATPTNLCQCRIAAARKKRFLRACNSAFLAIHLFALATVGFMVGDGWLFRVVAASIVVGPVLTYMAHSDSSSTKEPSTARGEAQEVIHG